MNQTSNVHTFEFYCSIDSLTKLLSEYRKITEGTKFPQILNIVLKETAKMGSTGPSVKNACFQTLFFAVHTMNTENIKVEILYE